MANVVRWHITVSRETDLAVRGLIASRGRSESELSKFVENAVNREIMRSTIGAIRSRNADRDSGEFERLAEAEIRAVRERS